MRVRATVAAVSGAVILSALALPAVAQADVRPGTRTLGSVTSKSMRAQVAVGNDTFSNGVINSGKDIVLGTTTKKSVSVTYTVTSPDGFLNSWVALWQGTDTETITGEIDAPGNSTCTATAADATVYNCKATVAIDASYSLYENGVAGTWKLFAATTDSDDVAQAYDDAAGSAKIKRNAKLTANAAPEPVKKGKTITVTGKLTRANWNTGAYSTYKGQSVQLQFRKKGSDTYTTLKSVTSGTAGALKATTTAKSDGYYRFVYAGNGTTGAVKATGDFVDVK